MQSRGQHITKLTYEDPDIVEGYIQRNALQPKQEKLLESFSKAIEGKRVLDLGCGPGHNAYLFAELGFETTGLDYSEEMIKRARELREVANQPSFLVGDMRRLPDYFADDSFDAIWASASLLHIPPSDVASVLLGMHAICSHGATVFIKLKAGDGTLLVAEDKLGKPMEREFTLWSKEDFLSEVIKTVPWDLTDYTTEEGSQFMGKPTTWHNFYFSVTK